MFTVTALLADRMFHITCHSKNQALSISRSVLAPLEVSVSEATCAEAATMQRKRVTPGGIHFDGLTLNDFMRWLEVGLRVK